MPDDVVVEGAVATETHTDPALSDAGAVPVVDPSQPTEQTDEIDFTDPAKLPADLQPLAKRLMASYTKGMQKISRDREKVALVEKFDSDPDFAANLIRYHAQRLGLLPNGQAQSTDPAKPTAPEIPDAIVKAAEDALPPELKWAAASIAATQMALHKQTVDPLIKASKERDKAERDQATQADLDALSAKAPGWEAHEDDMAEFIDFIRSPMLRHPKFGSKVEAVFRAVTGNARATTEAARRMADAGRQRVATGQPGRSAVPNIDERVRSAPTRREAFQIAAEAAVAEMERQGVHIA